MTTTETIQTGTKWGNSKLTHRIGTDGRPACGTKSRKDEYVTSSTDLLVTCYKCLGSYNTGR